MGVSSSFIESRSREATATYDGALWSIAAPASPLAVWQNSGSSIARSVLCFRTGLDPAAIVNSAILQIPTAAKDYTGSTFRAALLDRQSGEITAADFSESALVIPQTSGAVHAGGVLELDVTAAIAAAILRPGWTRQSYATLRLQLDMVSPGLTFSGFDAGLLDGPRLSIDATPVVSTDPYTLVANALWALLESSPDFVSMVRPGNRIKLLGAARNPLKRDVGAGDLPEVVILCGGSAPHQHRTTSSTSDTVTFSILVSTGERALDNLHFPLKAAIFRAIASYFPALMALEWNGTRIIQNVRLVSAEEGLSDPEANRGIVGWSTMWLCQVDLWFGTAAL